MVCRGRLYAPAWDFPAGRRTTAGRGASIPRQKKYKGRGAGYRSIDNEIGYCASLFTERCHMSEAKVVNAGVDTLVLNVFYTDERGRPVKCELDANMWRQLGEWKRAAQEMHEDIPTSLVFNDAVLHMAPNGAGQGQWPWLLRTKDITFYVSGGHWNGIASLRFSSQYLWSCGALLVAIIRGQEFVDSLFQQEMYLQVSSVDLCVDVAGWYDVAHLDRSENFIARSRKRGIYEESDWSVDLASREYSLGLQRTGFDFSRDKKASSGLSCRIYDKSREIEKSGKDWFSDLWRSRGWSEDDGHVWRVEFSFKREALHELQQENADQEVVFWGVEDAYDLPERLPVLWAYAAGQVNGGLDGLPDGWLRCVLSNGDRNRSRWPTHPVWQLIQGAFLTSMEMPPQFGKIVRKRWEDHNIDKGIEAVIGYLSSLAAWVGGDLADDGADLSVVLHWLMQEGNNYLQRVKRDFGAEVQRKRLKFGLQAPSMASREG